MKRNHLICWGILLIGVVSRLIRFLSNSPLWHDESSIALNLMARSFAELIQPLEYSQGAPAGWLWLSKWTGQLWGYSEWALRLPSLIAGIASLILFHRLTRRLLTGAGLWVSLALFSILEPLVHYSAELKPYVFDVLCSLLIVWLALAALDEPGKRKWVWALLATGVLSVWVSIASVFVLAATGAVLIIDRWRHRDSTGLWILGASALLWGISFGTHYLICLAEASRNNELLSWWKAQGAFMPIPPTSLKDCRWYGDSFLNFFIDPMGLGHAGLGAFLSIVGAALLWREDRRRIALLTAPILVVLMASMLGKYPWGTSDRMAIPLMGRSTLWCVPLVLLMVGVAVSGMASWLKEQLPRLWVALPIILLYPAAMTAAGGLLSPPVVQDVRSLISWMEAHRREGDAFCGNDLAIRNLLYYARRDALDWRDELHILVDWHPPIPPELAGRDRVWLFVSYIQPERSEQAKDRLLTAWRASGREVQSHVLRHGELYLFDLRVGADGRRSAR